VAIQVESEVQPYCFWQVLVEKLGVPDKDLTQTIREERNADPENAALGKSKARRCCKVQTL
jgi:hypothetical protein